MSDNDVIASVVENQDGQLDTEVGQDEGTIQEESSTQDWEAQAKYHQSEKDKLHTENQQLKQYEKIGKFLESRPDLVQNLMGEVSGQPNNQEAPLSSEYGLDNVLKMWRAVSQAPQTINDNPLDQVRQNQSNPQPAGVLQGSQPERKNETDKMWESVMSAGGRTNVLK